MNDEAQEKILQLLDVISVEVAAHRSETRTGFNRVDHRLGNLETRVENVETGLRTVQTDLHTVQSDVGILKTELRAFRGEFERRITPLEH